MVIRDRTWRTRKRNTTMDFETLNVTVSNGFSWQKLGSCGVRL